jgi:phosphoribosylanthranilate isomerase
MTLVKICGITTVDDALASVDAGADMLGFNFYRNSPRYIHPAKARAIIDQLPKTVLSVGVFVNEDSPSEVERLASESGVEAIQLHGDESPQFCRSLFSKMVVKAFRSTGSFRPEAVLEYSVAGVMLDAFHLSARGGTGHVANWEMARSVRDLVGKFYLAGGLTPLNVRAAIEAVNPYAVDACSGIECSPGKKDHLLVRDFVRSAKSVPAPASFP